MVQDRILGGYLNKVWILSSKGKGISSATSNPRWAEMTEVRQEDRIIKQLGGNRITISFIIRISESLPHLPRIDSCIFSDDQESIIRACVL